MKPLIFTLAALLLLPAKAEPVRIDIRPSATAAEIKAADSPHIVLVDAHKPGDKLLLWMPGTLGSPRVGAQLNFPTYAAQQGYRVIMLSYITDQGVSNICVGAALRANPDCAEAFRRKRIFGGEGFPLISDQPQDAIVYRFSKLLHMLKATRKDEHWEQFLNEDGSPRWERIAVAGQSQGGGHAAFIAKAKPVARVISLSGGWDKRTQSDIAGWYAKSSATPPERWFAAYHVGEPTAQLMADIARALNVPAANTGAFDRPVLGAKAHGEGMSNPAYLPWWRRALGIADAPN